MVVVREVQGLIDNVHQLDCDGLFEPWRRLRPRATHAVTEGNQPVKKADPPRCQGTGLPKGKPLSMNSRVLAR